MRKEEPEEKLGSAGATSVKRINLSTTMIWNIFVAFAIASALIGCTENNNLPDSKIKLSDNAELTKLYEQDQADRSGLFEDIDWKAISQRDSLRRVRVREMLDAEEVKTSTDYCHAAMVFQHGADTNDYRMAHDLAIKAVGLDTTNTLAKQMIAMSWDRYLQIQGKPQWYGTQYTKQGEQWVLYEVDTTAVTDEDRRKLNVPTLAEIKARIEEMNKRK
ncbi:hypothetical protein L0337_15925 [candidate division KSB1 bacterium]|nr:hypothetical protein [candidate division KSB1 bacterium]